MCSADKSAQSAEILFRLHFSVIRMGSRGTFVLLHCKPNKPTWYIDIKLTFVLDLQRFLLIITSLVYIGNWVTRDCEHVCNSSSAQPGFTTDSLSG